MDTSMKVRENRLRQMAARRGLRLIKSPQRDPGGLDHGRYRIETAGRTLPPGVEPGRQYPFADMDEVERYLTLPR